MKTISIYILISLISTALAFSQTRSPQDDMMNYVPGELIIKLKDGVDAGVKYKSVSKGISQTTISKNIGILIGLDSKVESYEALFSDETVQKSLKLVEDTRIKKQANKNPNQVYQGPDYDHSLKNVFKVKFKDESENIIALIDQLKKSKLVEYAEPNFIFSVNDFTIDSDIIYDKDLKDIDEDELAPLSPNDPLYSDQSNITQANIDDVWGEYTTGDGSQIVAILDTGVDYTHPDLEANIWENTAEKNGVAGYDDDGNGYIDDIRGWDFINQDNAPLDDNMHGTHVAGIVGAVGDNGIGIAGAAWNVKLMPIKVFQSNGTGNSSTIAEGVTYATNNGATIHNMSFGSYAESQTLKSALETAYASSVLIAAAGNDRTCIGPGPLCAPSYPGAYTFILGVEDRPKPISGYTNYDQDGPIYSNYSNFLNYELASPGTSILSTVPNGGYRKLTGTSMATPLVAGAIALYNQQKPDYSKELLFGNFINTSLNSNTTNPGFFDLKAALEVIPTPKLKILSAIIRDTINSQNGNGYFEPGEILEIFPTVKNYWGPSDDVRVGIEFWEFEDTSKAQILTSSSTIGSITAYSNIQSLSNPLKIKLGDGISNNTVIQFKVSVWVGENQEFLSYEKIEVNIKNAEFLEGIISESRILNSGKEYLVINNVVVNGTASLTIEPGTILKFSDGKKITFIDNSRLICIGSKDKNITLMAENKSWGGLSFESKPSSMQIDEYPWNIISFTNISNISTDYVLQNSEWLLIEDSNFIECDSYYQSIGFSDKTIIRRSNFILNKSRMNFITSNNVYSSIWDIELKYQILPNQNYSQSLGVNMYDINYIENTSTNPFSISNPNKNTSHLYIYSNESEPIFYRWNAFQNDIDKSGMGITVYPDFTINSPVSGNLVTVYPDLYLGSSSQSIIDSRSRHYLNNDDSTKVFDWSHIANSPFEKAHGIVWKVLVNGKDAQDEYDSIDPVGVGDHNFKVYFNRQMDTLVKPTISYGVREPYNQKIISETGSWATDGKSYTVTHTIGIGAADGINRIRVEGAKDLDNFDIPVEDYRFNFLLQSAGSASAGFAATAGLGEITLGWDAPSESDLNDILGYNMYRYTANDDGTYTDPVKINSSLITDVSYKDYNVVRETQYYYKYKVLRTSFEETDYSKAVSTKLLTASLGDSNGDSAVNVLDVVNTVDYILGNNPTPYIDYATDVNSDSAINVLDIVGIVDLILNPSTSSVRLNGEPINYYSTLSNSKATFYWDKNDLYLVNDETIGGIQMAFDKGFKYSLNKELNGFETLNYQQDDEEMLVVFALNENELKPGKHKILTKEVSSEELEITKAVLASKKGTPIDVDYYDIPLDIIKSPLQTETMRIISYAPNPTDGPIDLYYYLPEDVEKLNVSIYDLSGNLIHHTDDLKNTSGYSHKELNLSGLKPGMYILSLYADSNSAMKYNKTVKIIIE